VARSCWVWVGFIQLLEFYVVLIVFPDLKQWAKLEMLSSNILFL